MTLIARRMCQTLAVGTALLTGAAATAQTAQEWPVEVVRLDPVSAPQESYVGTVRARDMYGLSYGTTGCIVGISEEAKRMQVAKAGQVLVELDDKHSQLALKTAEARLAELRAAVEERQLAVTAAENDDRRRAEDRAFVAKEFERNQTMFRRGLINETTMEAVESRMMDATFAAEQAKEAMASARSAKARAEISVGIGELELQTAEIDHEDLQLVAPFDGVMIGFEPSVGACVSDGALAGQIYDPSQKSVDVYVLISRLSAQDATGVSRGAEVTVRRGNGQTCGGAITRIDTEADLESQYVQTTIDVDEACAPELFLNEAVAVEMNSGPDAFRLPETALLEGSVYIVNEERETLESIAADVVSREDGAVVVRLPGMAGRLAVVDAMSEGVDAMLETSEPS
ncbi:efflux RND transporter periplasmic adaptor subunit [Sagittula sp.]|uniref:efflux RND transporter periplasmic adaptor subunit n=1 Tax=Sagittula sp. TaxID=2038081 RepID=UPI0035133E26